MPARQCAFNKCFKMSRKCLLTPENPQCCKGMIAERSIQIYFHVSSRLVTLAGLPLVNTVFKNCQKLIMFMVYFYWILKFD